MSEGLDHEPYELRELTVDETDLVSGGCGGTSCSSTCCPKGCDCPG
jgi:hypothetical protein